MGTRAEQKIWVEAALADGWVREEWDTKLPGEHYFLKKQGFVVYVHFGRKSEHCSLKINTPEMSDFEPWSAGQKDGYNWEAIARLPDTCAHCYEFKGKENLVRFARMICIPCRDKIQEFAKKHPIQERVYIGEAEVEFRHVHGRKATNVVKEYRVIAKIRGKSYWEPYNGNSSRSAYNFSSATQLTLSIAGYKVHYKEIHTTWNGDTFSLPEAHNLGRGRNKRVRHASAD